MNNPHQFSDLDVILDYMLTRKGFAPSLLALQLEEETTMEKYFTYSGSAKKYKTRGEAEDAAKKYMESTSKNYGINSNVDILEAIATVRFPVPNYEVVDLAKA